MLPDANPLIRTITTELGCREDPAVPPLASVKNFLLSRNLLLIVDNWEHLIDACAEVADAISKACHSIEILASSLEPLGVDGQIAWRGPSMSVPRNDAELSVTRLRDPDSVRLFVERASGLMASR